MSFLIIGGAGFVGSNLAKYLAKKTEDKIHIIDNLSSGKKENLSCIDPSRISLNYIRGPFRSWDGFFVITPFVFPLKPGGIIWND